MTSIRPAKRLNILARRSGPRGRDGAKICLSCTACLIEFVRTLFAVNSLWFVVDEIHWQPRNEFLRRFQCATQ